MKNYKEFTEYILENTDNTKKIPVLLKVVSSIRDKAKLLATQKRKGPKESLLTKQFIEFDNAIRDSKRPTPDEIRKFERTINNLSSLPESQITKIDQNTDLKINKFLELRAKEVDAGSMSDEKIMVLNNQRPLKRDNKKIDFFGKMLSFVVKKENDKQKNKRQSEIEQIKKKSRHKKRVSVTSQEFI